MAIFTICVLIVTYQSIVELRNFQQSNLGPASESSGGLLNVGRAKFDLTSPKINCSSFLASLDSLESLNIAFLYNTFGNNFDCLKTIMADPRLSALEIELINEPGHRNKRLEKQEFLYKIPSPARYAQLLKKRDKKLRAKFDAYVVPIQNILTNNLQPHTTCYVNPGLESNVDLRAAKVLMEWSRVAFPNCQLVWNPLSSSGSAAQVGADLIEGHGSSPTKLKGRCITNLDGTDVNFPRRKSYAVKTYKEGTPKNWINAGNALQQYLEEYANKCELAFVWIYEDNCFNEGYAGAFIPPLKRQCKTGKMDELAGAEVEYAQQHGKVAPLDLSYDETDKLSFNGCTSIKKKWNDKAKSGKLIKQSEFSDRGGVIILPGEFDNASSVKLVSDGKVIDSYQKSGNYEHDSSNRPLWRSNITPIKYPYKVVAQIKMSNKKVICYPIPNPRIRQD